MIRVVTNPYPSLIVPDGYGLPFDPDTHLLHIQAALTEYDRLRLFPLPPTVEPVWKDRPAGAKCIPLFEDKECERAL